MPSRIYELFDKATAQVGAYAILDASGAYVARIVFRYPADGAGRLYCYAQAWGAAMARDFAGGGGYDKRTAAAYAAVRKLKPDSEFPSDGRGERTISAMQAALSTDGGKRWSDQLEAAGFRVLCVAD